MALFHADDADNIESISQIIAYTRQNLTYNDVSYRGIKAAVINGISKIALDPNRSDSGSLNSAKDAYTFMCKDSESIDTDLVKRLLRKEAFIEKAFVSGHLTLQTRTNGQIWLEFDKSYIDSLIKGT